MKLTARSLAAGTSMPRGYGVAYHRYDADVIIAYPVPLNLIVSWARWLWFGFSVRWLADPAYMRFGEAKAWVQQSVAATDAAAYARGHQAGLEDLATAMAELTSTHPIAVIATYARWKRRQAAQEITIEAVPPGDAGQVPNPYGKSILAPKADSPTKIEPASWPPPPPPPAPIRYREGDPRNLTGSTIPPDEAKS